MLIPGQIKVAMVCKILYLLVKNSYQHKPYILDDFKELKF